MAVTVTVEDGSNVSGANSFVSVADLVAYAEQRGIALTGDADAQGAKLIRAGDYINGLRSRFKGTKTNDDQTMQFPRTGVYIDGVYLDQDTIPEELISAQCELAIAAENGVDLLPGEPGSLPIIRDKTGPLETEYARPSDLVGSSWQKPRLEAADRLLAPLLKGSGQLTTVRA